jgi:hypothetical protein
MRLVAARVFVSGFDEIVSGGAVLGEVGKQVEKLRQGRKGGRMNESDPEDGEKTLLSETVVESGSPNRSGRGNPRRSRTVRPRRPKGDEGYAAELAELTKRRPKNSTECAENGAMTRPCPWVACRYHLYLDINATGNIKFNFPWLEPWELEAPCALAYVEDGGLTLELIGKAVNLTRERVRQMEVTVLEKVKGMGVFSPEDAEDLGKKTHNPITRDPRPIGHPKTALRNEMMKAAERRMRTYADEAKEKDVEVTTIPGVTITGDKTEKLQRLINEQDDDGPQVVVNDNGEVLLITPDPEPVVEIQEVEVIREVEAVKEVARKLTVDQLLEDLDLLGKDEMLARIEDLPAWLRRACYTHWREDAEW